MFERAVVIGAAREVVEVEVVFHAARLHDEVDKGSLFVRPQGVEGAGIGVRFRFALFVIAVSLRVGKGGAHDPTVGNLRVRTDFDRVELMLHAEGVILIFAAVVASPGADRRGTRAKGRHAVVERRDFVAPGDEARGGQVVRHLRDVGTRDRGVALFIDPDGVVGTEAVALPSTVKARRREQQTDVFCCKTVTTKIYCSAATTSTTRLPGACLAGTGRTLPSALPCTAFLQTKIPSYPSEK